MRRRRPPFAAAALGLLAGCASPEGALEGSAAGTEAAAPGTEDSAPVPVLLARLGDEDFPVRERATQALVRRGPSILPDLERMQASTPDPEIALRCRQIRAAIERVEQTGFGVLACIQRSGATFLRPRALRGEYSAARFASHLRTKAWLRGFSLSRPAGEFIDEIATESSRHETRYRVRLAGGEVRDLAEWLQEQIAP